MVVFFEPRLADQSLLTPWILAAFCWTMAAMAFVLSVVRWVHRMSILVICGVMIGYICSAVTDIVVAFLHRIPTSSTCTQLVHGQLFPA